MASIAMRTLSDMDRPWRRKLERRQRGHRAFLHGGEHSGWLAANKPVVPKFHAPDKDQELPPPKRFFSASRAEKAPAPSSPSLNGANSTPALRGCGSIPRTRNSVASAPISTVPSIRGSGGSLLSFGSAP